MNKLFARISGGLLALLMLAGCATNRAPLTKEQKIDRAVRVLKVAVSSAVTVAADDRKQETRDKILMARKLVNDVVQTDEITPELIVNSLAPLWRDAKPEIRIAATTALGLLEAYFQDYVIALPQEEGVVNAKKFLSAVVAGIDEGLLLSPPVVAVH